MNVNVDFSNARKYSIAAVSQFYVNMDSTDTMLTYNSGKPQKMHFVSGKKKNCELTNLTIRIIKGFLKNVSVRGGIPT